MPQPRWGQVREFCRKQGYRETRTDHYHYVKVLPDRSVSRTMVSFGSDAELVPRQMWTLVWKRQLKLASEEEFWKGLAGEAAQFASAPSAEPPQPLPGYLVKFLREQLRYSEEEIARTSREDAQGLLNRFYAGELRSDEP